MTQDEFNQLPALLSRGVLADVTGLSDATISEMVKQKKLKVYRPPVKNGHRRYAKYYKWQAAEIAGFKL